MLGRYFYFESNGSNSNSINFYTEIQIVDTDGVNRALGRGLARYSSIHANSKNPSVVTDGDTNTNNYFATLEGQHHIVIDLGDVYDISYIKIWRYYGDSRRFKDVVIQVSEDDINYITVFSSVKDGTYAETAEGKQIDILNFEPKDLSAPIFDMPLKNSLEYTGESCAINADGSDAITFAEDAFSATTYNDITINFPNALNTFTIFLRFKIYSNGASQYPYYRRLIWGFDTYGGKVFGLEVGYSGGQTTNKMFHSKSFTDALDDDNWHTCVLKKYAGNIHCVIDDVYTDVVSGSSALKTITISQKSYVLNGLIKDVKVYDGIVDEFDDTEPEEPSTKLYYNGARLPTIPDGVLSEYPYAWIRKNYTTGYYDLILSKLQPWYDSSSNGVVYGTQQSGESICYCVPILESNNAKAWTFNFASTLWFGIDTNRTVLWSNTDIPYKSETATVFYIHGSTPVDENAYLKPIGRTLYHDGLTGVLLPSIPQGVLEAYPYAWITYKPDSNTCSLICFPNGAYRSGSSIYDKESVAGPRYLIATNGMVASFDRWSYIDNKYGGFTVSSPTKVAWSNHDIPNGSATATDIYCRATEPIPESSMKSVEIDYETNTNVYVSGDRIYYNANSEPIVSYVVPVEKSVIYKVTATEVGNRLRAAFTTTDPSTINSDVAATNVAQPANFSAGYTLYAIAPDDGWLVVYVSNAGETPNISIARIDTSPYTALEFIQSSGTQYIDTGYYPNANTRVEADLYIYNYEDFTGLYGVVGNNQHFAFRLGQGNYIAGVKYPAWILSYGETAVSTSITQGVDRGRNKIDHTGATVTVTGPSASCNCSLTSSSTFTGTSSYPLYIFAFNNGETPVDIGSFSLYSFKIYDGETLVRDFKPAQRNDGVIGLYDHVEGVFYTNSGSGEFSSNLPYIPPRLPRGYTELEYIESDGSQYIDTGFCATSHTHAYIEVMVKKNNPTAMIYGSYGGSCNFAHINTSSNGYTLQYCSASSTALLSSLGNKASIDHTGSSSYVNDGTHGRVMWVEYPTFDNSNPYPMYLFTVNNAGVPEPSNAMRLYIFKVRDEGVMVRCFVPAKRNSDGEIGVYDTINDVFYTNAGTGTFVAGPEIVCVWGPDSVACGMTLISGIARSITGGMAMLNGVVRTITEGMVIIEGVPKKIAFVSETNGTPVSVSITGTGNESYCYATIGGAKFISQGYYMGAHTGDVITFGIYGANSVYDGWVNIDGVDAIRITNGKSATYDWTVPDGITEVTIKLTCYNDASSTRRGRITVTTS